MAETMTTEDTNDKPKKKNAAAEEALKKKLQQIELAEAQLNKQFGRGSIFRFNTGEKYEWPFIPTGSLTLDLALGIGGVPRGRIVEIFGPESSGKSTLCMTIVAQAQKAGGIAAYIDSEHALDPKYVRALGVDFDNMLISQPDYGEQALDTVETLAKTGAVDIIVVDSVASLIPKAEFDGTMHDQTMGAQAKMMSHHLRRINGVVHDSNTTLIFVNQLRYKIGVFFGNPETQPGGTALKFYSSIRLDIRRIGDVKTGTDKVGHRAKVKVVKNKMAPPFKEAEFDIMWGRGINNFGCVIDLAVEKGLLVKKGAYYRLPDDDETIFGHGTAQAIERLASDLDLYDEWIEIIRNG